MAPTPGRNSFGGRGGRGGRGGKSPRGRSPSQGSFKHQTPSPHQKHSPGNRGRGSFRGRGGSPHKSPRGQMTPKMNGKGDQSPFKAHNFKGQKSPGKTPQKSGFSPMSKPSPFKKEKKPIPKEILEGYDNDPDDMDEEDLQKLLNRDSSDEDDDFSMDSSNDDEESDDEPSGGVTIKEVNDDDSDEEDDEKTETNTKISKFLKKMKNETNKTQDDEEEDLDESGEDEDDDDDEDDDEDEDEDDDVDDEEIEKLLKKMKEHSSAIKKENAKEKATKVNQQKSIKGKESDDDDDEDDDDDDEENDKEIEKLLQKMKERTSGINKKEEDEDDDDDEEDEDDDEDDDDDDDEDDEDADEEIEKLLQKMKAKTSPGMKHKDMEEEDEDEDDEDESDSEVEKLLQKMKEKSTKDEEDEDDEEDDDDEDDSDEDDSEVEKLLQKMKDNKKKAETAAASRKRSAPGDSDEDEDDDVDLSAKPATKKMKAVMQEEDDSEELDDSEEELMTAKKTPAKSGQKRRAPDDDEEFQNLVAKSDQKKGIKAAAATEKAPVSAETSKPSALNERRYLQPTPTVNDPKLRKELEKMINNRLESTLRIRPVPPQVRSEDIESLCPAAVGIRIPWNKMTRRSRRVAFVEFSDKETCQKWLEKLKGSLFQKKKLMVDKLTADSGIDAYNCRRLVVSNLPWNIEKATLMTKFPKADHVDILTGGATDKRMPAVAFVTFKTERDAMNSFEQCHGAAIKGRRVSIGFQKKPHEFDHNTHLELVVFGIRKSVKEGDLLAIFTRAKELERKQGQGMATLKYETHADCYADFNDRKGARIGGRKLVVTFGSRKHQEADGKSVKPTTKKPEPTKANQTTDGDKQSNIDRKTVFLNHLHKKTREEDLRKVFPQLVSIDMPLKGKLCRGTAVIRFPHEKAAANAIQKAKSVQIHGRTVEATLYSKSMNTQSLTSPEKTTPTPTQSMDMEVDDSDDEVALPPSASNVASGDAKSGKKKKKKKKKQGQPATVPPTPNQQQGKPQKKQQGPSFQTVTSSQQQGKNKNKKPNKATGGGPAFQAAKKKKIF